MNDQDPHLHQPSQQESAVISMHKAVLGAMREEAEKLGLSLGQYIERTYTAWRHTEERYVDKAATLNTLERTVLQYHDIIKTVRGVLYAAMQLEKPAADDIMQNVVDAFGYLEKSGVE